MDGHTFLKLTFLVFAIWMIIVTIGRTAKGQEVSPFTLGLGCVSIVGFCYMQGWIV